MRSLLASLLLGSLLTAVTACSKEAAPAVVPAATPSTTTGAAVPVTPDAPPAPVGAAVVGNAAPEFTLKDLDGNDVALSSFKGKTVVLEWFNPECPFVKAAHGKGSLVGMAKKHTEAGIVWLAINSSAPGKQGYDLDKNVAAKAAWQLPHAILRDETGTVGKAYGATNTPHLFVIDPNGVVVYGGAIDNSPDGEGASPAGGVLVNHVEDALADLAAKRPVKVATTKAYGCGVKY
ncbi:MAG TPA: thioredoxin family protein [Myxococcota bacterium]